MAMFGNVVPVVLVYRVPATHPVGLVPMIVEAELKFHPMKYVPAASDAVIATVVVPVFKAIVLLVASGFPDGVPAVVAQIPQTPLPLAVVVIAIVQAVIVADVAIVQMTPATRLLSPLSVPEPD